MGKRSAEQDAVTVGAVDLGSNSFHMVIGRLVDGRMQVVDRMRERVQLAAGLDESGRLDATSQTRALDCLERFGQRLRGLPSHRVRAVGTNALRAAKNRASFLRRAKSALGHPVEVISGREEGRILYRGVASALPRTDERRLVIDIGGGSTECALGHNLETERLESLRMGCVSYSARFFADGKLTRDRFKRAMLAARLELEPFEQEFREAGFQQVVGSSGTILALERMVVEAGLASQGITAQALSTLRRRMIEAEHTALLDLPGLNQDRRGVIPGGLAILQAVLKSLQIGHMTTSRAALREGLLLELVGGPEEHRDARSETVRQLARRFSVDDIHGQRVSETARSWAVQVRKPWNLSNRDVQLLGWAGTLHELGQVLTFSGYHRHGAYLIQHADMPGFSTEAQLYMAALVESHRRSLKPARVAALEEAGGLPAKRAAVLLRLAVRLHRGRSPKPPPHPELKVGDGSIELTFPEGWLDDHPMTEADLAAEAELLKVAGFELQFR